MSDKRKIELFDEMLNYISEVAYSSEDFKLTLSAIGFSAEEIVSVCSETSLRELSYQF